jgi:hypothetical protein
MTTVEPVPKTDLIEQTRLLKASLRDTLSRCADSTVRASGQ